MVITYDLYKELELDRSWDETAIKSRLKEIQRLWTKRQSACNDKEQLMLIDNILSKVGEGFKYLVKKIKRKEYDTALDTAYKKGQIKDETEAKMKSLIEEAGGTLLCLRLKLCRLLLARLQQLERGGDVFVAHHADDGMGIGMKAHVVEVLRQRGRGMGIVRDV